MKYFVLIAFIFISCSKSLTPEEIVQKSIVVYGLDKNHSISFDFRKKQYIMKRVNGHFTYQRILQDTVDILNNIGFTRTIEGTQKEISSRDSLLLASSLNSVIYFASLPLPLKDDAVQLKLLDEESDGKNWFYKIQVTFSKENGGIDFEDRFIYWFNKNTYKLKYFTYLYHVNGGGSRFRVVRNTHAVHGIELLDYDNYKFKEKSSDINEYLKEYVKNNLIKVSEINLKNVKKIN